MVKKIYYILLFFLLSANIYPQDVSFTASAPNVVKAGERFRLTYSINKSGKNFTMPPITDFQVLMGPSKSSSFQSNYINGKLTSSTTISYSFILLANKEGKFTIPSAKINVKKEEYSSNSVTIEVVKNDNPQNNNNQTQQQTNRPNTPSTQQQTPIDSKENFFARLNLSRKNLYKGEHLIATIKIYSKYTQIGSLRIQPPAFEGFLSQEIKNAQQTQFRQENINGTIYNTAVLGKYVLFPQRSGKLTIEPFEFECVARVRSSSGDFFEDFFGQNIRDIQVKTKSPKYTVNVKRLPANAPYNFSGGVGSFTIQSSINNDSIQANEAITLNVNIKGNGNLKLLKPLKFNFPPDFEVYDPEKTQNIRSTSTGMNGSISYKYLIIPQFEGKFTIPSAGFSYFDPKTESYKQVATPTYQIAVGRNNTNNNAANVTSYNKEDVKFLGEDIRFIKTHNLALYPIGKFFFGSSIFYIILILSFVIFWLIFIVYRKVRKDNKNFEKRKHRLAKRVAKKRLYSAKQSLKKHDKNTFYDNILNALWGYTSDKFNIPLSKLTKDNVSGLLLQKKVSQDLISEFLELLDRSEYAKYAPAKDEGAMDKIYAEAIVVLSKLEDEV